ncbi:hypothetical protein PS9374_07018 [Planomonospora sphaerica]|uniref:Uncharacterized protein n=1 Tax=Planomonospora sphaerica TaxID=161355 RepID=A0A161LP26_9ACTN|nr:hypothetical protein PS9374_07018 [Planomonospora sphaerica]
MSSNATLSASPDAAANRNSRPSASIRNRRLCNPVNASRTACSARSARNASIIATCSCNRAFASTSARRCAFNAVTSRPTNAHPTRWPRASTNALTRTFRSTPRPPASTTV